MPNPAVVSAVQQGRQLLRSDPRRAMAAVTVGLKIEPQNKDLQGILAEIVKRSRQDAATARNSVLRHGQAAVDANATFRDATTKLNDAARAERSRPENAPGLYWQAADLLGRADREVAETLSKAAAAAAAATKAAPPPEPKPPVPTMPTNPQTTPPGTTVPPAPCTATSGCQSTASDHGGTGHDGVITSHQRMTKR